MLGCHLFYFGNTIVCPTSHSWPLHLWIQGRCL
uniref:Uncharacterized protein n=1 Tax=Anguilla anguilla TaxID=7936 RepID=A0A0E9XSA0_ANGAN